MKNQEFDCYRAIHKQMKRNVQEKPQRTPDLCEKIQEKEKNYGAKSPRNSL